MRFSKMALINKQLLPEAFRSVLGLGPFKRYFAVKKFSRGGNVILALFLLACAAAVAAYGVYDAYWWTQRNGLVMFMDKLTGPAIIALLLFLIAFLPTVSAYHHWKMGAVVYEKGFAYRDRKGIRTWRWEDLISLTAAVTRHYTNGVYTGTTHRYTLIDRKNGRLVLGDVINQIEELSRAIEEGIFPILYDRAIGCYNAGESLTFGPVVLNKIGIQIGSKMYPWNDVKQVSIQRGILRVSKRDGGLFSGARAAASTIPNLRVLLSIVDQIVGIKAA